MAHTFQVLEGLDVETLEDNTVVLESPAQPGNEDGWSYNQCGVPHPVVGALGQLLLGDHSKVHNVFSVPDVLNTSVIHNFVHSDLAYAGLGVPFSDLPQMSKTSKLHYLFAGSSVMSSEPYCASPLTGITWRHLIPRKVLPYNRNFGILWQLAGNGHANDTGEMVSLPDHANLEHQTKIGVHLRTQHQE